MLAETQVTGNGFGDAFLITTDGLVAVAVAVDEHHPDDPPPGASTRLEPGAARWLQSPDRLR